MSLWSGSEEWWRQFRPRHCVDCGSMLVIRTPDLICPAGVEPRMALVCPHCDQIGECGPSPWPCDIETAEQFYRHWFPDGAPS